MPSNKLPLVEQKATIHGAMTELRCTCNFPHKFYLRSNETTLFHCEYCNTDWKITTNTKVRKTSEQINKELGYKIYND